MTDEDKTLASTAGENVELNSAQEPSGSNANEILTSGGINENKIDEDLLTQAAQSMQIGKRHLIVNDFSSAASCFELASEILGHCYGIESLECAEAYLNYGISLYEMSRIEEGLEGGIVNVDQKDSDSESDSAEPNEKGAEESEDESEEDTAKDDENLKSSITETDLPNAEPSTSKSEPGCSTAVNGEKNEDDEEPTNFEIAYEVLVTAKNIYSKHLHKIDARINYAEALHKLGEISIDWENLDGAIEYLNECLKHRRDILEPDDRLIAHTYHYLGLAYSFKHEPDLSNKCFQSALDVIQLRLDNLKAKKATNQFDLTEKDMLENEIKQLEGLVPEIQAKIEDVKEQIQSHFKAMAALAAHEKKEEDLRKIQEHLNKKPVNLINHLIKRKRNENDEENNHEKNANESNLSKKICITPISDTMKTGNDSCSTSTSTATMPVSSSSSNNDVESATSTSPP